MVLTVSLIQHLIDRKRFPCLHKVMEVRGNLGEREKRRTHEARASVSTAVLSSPKLSRAL